MDQRPQGDHAKDGSVRRQLADIHPGHVSRLQLQPVGAEAQEEAKMKDGATPDKEHLKTCPYCNGLLHVFRVFREDVGLPPAALDAMEASQVDVRFWLYRCDDCMMGVWKPTFDSLKALEKGESDEDRSSR
tara:strand:- start:385 stop:777 length:393 start_codon:yes stop_codon:yes gene_type:complete